MVPVDLPELRFYRESLLMWHDDRKVRVDEKYTAEIDNPWWVSFIRDTDRGIDYDRTCPIWNLKDVLRFLPHTTMKRIYLLEQIIDVQPHRDVSREDRPELGPSTYRNLIIDDTNGNSFYYLRGTRARQNRSDEKVFAKLPSSTRWFVHNNYSAEHGAILPPDGARKLMLCFWGTVDVDFHTHLVQDGMKKYAEYVIT